MAGAGHPSTPPAPEPPVTANHDPGLERILRWMPARGALYAVAHLDGGPPELVWLVREEQSSIRALGPDATITWQGHIYRLNNVILGLVLIRLRPSPACEPLLYELFLNAHEPGGEGREALDFIQHQPEFILHIHVEDSKPRLVLRTPNHLQRFATNLLALVKNHPAWTMQQFNAAKGQLHEQFPDPWTLWHEHDPREIAATSS